MSTTVWQHPGRPWHRRDREESSNDPLRGSVFLVVFFSYGNRRFFLEMLFENRFLLIKSHLLTENLSSTVNLFPQKITFVFSAPFWKLYPEFTIIIFHHWFNGYVGGKSNRSINPKTILFQVLSAWDPIAALHCFLNTTCPREQATEPLTASPRPTFLEISPAYSALNSTPLIS